MSFYKIFPCLAGVILTSIPLLSCTGMELISKDGTPISGRTVEFGIDLDMSVAVVPRNYSFVGDAPKGAGKEYVSKYAYVGAYCFTNQKIMDGMNEKGLVAAAFYFPGYAEYKEVSQEDSAKAISPIEFPNWVLSQFGSIDEVKEALSSIIIAPTVSNDWGPTPPPMHYIIYDNSGKSLVVEPVNGSLSIVENPIGVFTNSPTFDWHLTNLNNYINLSPYNKDEASIKKYPLAPLGQGSGLLGLPGDFTAPSRFVRAAFFSSLAPMLDTAEETVAQLFHLLNQFDIPKGSVRAEKDGKDFLEITWVTCAKDPKNQKYYYRSYQDQEVKVISLKDFDLDSSEIKSMQIKGTPSPIEVSSSLH